VAVLSQVTPTDHFPKLFELAIQYLSVAGNSVDAELPIKT